jgi:[ribosomal protein S18]-alanine N-acetyltransferase
VTTVRAAELRPATPDDLPALLVIERASFARPWSEASLREELERTDRVWLVVAEGGEVVAFAGGADLAGDLHVLTVAVATAARRRGHARRLVHALLAAGRERFGTTRATLEVRASDRAARALYRSCGFTETGVRPGYYQDDREDAVVLWCEDPGAASATVTDRPPPEGDTS